MKIKKLMESRKLAKIKKIKNKFKEYWKNSVSYNKNQKVFRVEGNDIFNDKKRMLTDLKSSVL